MRGRAIIRLVLLLVGLRSTPLLAQLLASTFSPLQGSYHSPQTVSDDYGYGRNERHRRG
jgi:hypothetical protein